MMFRGHDVEAVKRSGVAVEAAAAVLFGYLVLSLTRAVALVAARGEWFTP